MPMSSANDPTPGQVCYEAFLAARYPRSTIDDIVERWHEIDAEGQAPWEAAAQAVRMAYKAELEACADQTRQEEEPSR